MGADWVPKWGCIVPTCCPLFKCDPNMEVQPLVPDHNVYNLIQIYCEN